MAVLKKDFKFKKISNFLSKEELELGLHYLLLKHKRNTTEFDFVQNNCGDSAFYNDPFTQTILVKKLTKMKEETGLDLIPTYAFSRIYSYDSELTPHKDRPSCEVSVTTMWGSCGTEWPIYMDGTECHMKPGDAVIYLGCELEHYRKNFTGDYHVQTFLHYVDKNGPYTNHAYDNKPYIFNPLI